MKSAGRKTWRIFFISGDFGNFGKLVGGNEKREKVVLIFCHGEFKASRKLRGQKTTISTFPLQILKRVQNDVLLFGMTCFFNNIVIKMNGRYCRHCEERSDEAIYTKEKSLRKTVCLEEKWIASHGRLSSSARNDERLSC